MKWIQRKDKILITIEVANSKDVRLETDVSNLEFECKVDDTKYEVNLELFKEIIPKVCFCNNIIHTS